LVLGVLEEVVQVAPVVLVAPSVGEEVDSLLDLFAGVEERLDGSLAVVLAVPEGPLILPTPPEVPPRTPPAEGTPEVGMTNGSPAPPTNWSARRRGLSISSFGCPCSDSGAMRGAGAEKY
jgi:hypothetical protein